MIAICASSCIAPAGIKRTEIVDYKRYFDKGFFLTESNSVSFDYSPIASVFTIVKGSTQQPVPDQKSKARAWADDDTKATTKYSARDRREGGAQPATKVKSVRYDIYDALDELVNKSYKLGANGIINLKITYALDKDYGYRYEVSGMAIHIYE